MPTPTLDDEVTFLSGVADDGTLALQSYASWNPNTNPADYSGGFTNAYKWGADTAGTPGGQVNYYFDPASSWNSTEQNTLAAGLALWSDIANITFVQTTDPSQAMLTFVRGTSGGAFTNPTLSGGSDAGLTGGSTLLTPTAITISIQTGAVSSGFGPIDGNFQTSGGYVFDTLVHEEGHAMGLGHGGPYNGNVSPSSQQFSPYDSRAWSIMSYIDPYGTGSSSAKYFNQYPVDPNWGTDAQGETRVPTTWMQADILAVQRLYGMPAAGTPLMVGHTTFGFNSNVAGPSGEFFNFNINTSPVITIWDGGLDNTLDLSGWSTSSTVNLNPGTFSSADGMTDNIAIAQGTAIDNFVGGSGNDTITVNSDNDTINGGGGTNIVEAPGNSSDYTITFNSDGTIATLHGPSITDTLTNIQNVAFDDATVSAQAIIDNSGLTFSSSGTIADSIIGTGSVTVTNGAIVSLVGYNAYSGGTTVTSGGLWIGGAGGFGNSTHSGSLTGNVSLPNAEFPNGPGLDYLGFGRSDAYTFGGNISGVGHVEVEGGGTLTLTGDNSAHTGYLDLGNNSVLQVASDANLGGGTIRMSTGTLRFLASYTSNLNYDLTRAAFDTNGHNITLTGALTTQVNTNTPLYGGISKAGAGILTLASTNSFVGISYLNGGTLALSGSSGLSSSAEVIDNAVLDISQITGANTAIVSLSGSGAVSLGSKTLAISNGGGTTLDANSNPSGVFSGVIADGGIGGGTGGGLTISGGTEYLTGANTFTGTTTIASGAKLVIGNNSATGSLGSGAVTDNGTLAFNLTVDAIAGNAISGSGNLEQDDSHTVTLTGNNSYLGTTLIAAGILQIGNGGTGGTLGGGAVTDNAILAFDHSDNITLSRAISGSGSLNQIGSGLLTITAAQSYTATTGVVAGSRLALSGAGSVANSAVQANGTFDISQTGGAAAKGLFGTGIVALGGQVLTITGGNTVFGGVLQDGGIAGGSGGGLAVSGGSLTLTGANTYTGATTIAANATLMLGNNTATGSLGSGAVTDNGTLAYNLSSATTLGSVISGSGELDQDGTGRLTVTAVENYAGQTLINSGSTLALSGGGSLANASVMDILGIFDISGVSASSSTVQGLLGNGTVALGNKTLILSAAGNHVFGGTIQDGGIAGGSGGSLTISGGLQSLTGASTYTGLTTINSGATLAIGNNSATGSLGSGAVTDNGTLEYYLTGQTNVANAISGSGGLLQAGGGNLILGAPESYTGATMVNAGTVTVDGSIAASATTVHSGGTLGGTGMVGGVSVLSGGKLNAGNSIGTLHVSGNLTMASGSTYGEDLSFSSADETIVSGTASISGTLAENFSGNSYVVGETYTILSAAGGLSGTFSNVSASGLPAGFSAVVTYDSNNAYVTIQNSAANGFSGPTKNDIVWQSTNGQATMSQLSGGTFVTAPVIGGDPGPTWHVEGSADFNGDGNSDILWKNDSGAVVTWLMNGSTIASGASVGSSSDPNWNIVGTGDFNGDGKSDILWKSASGQVVTWFMNGSTIASGASIGSSSDPNWHIVGTGDFNGDGKSDILWQNDNGQVVTWLMNGSSIASGASIGSSAGPGWRIVGTGDFDGDGKSDILWQNNNGLVVAWFMNGSTITSGAVIGTASNPTWNIVGTGDFNGDGKTDIVWQNTAGQAVTWFMNGSTIISGASAGNLGPQWQIVNNHPLTLPPKTRGSDYNGDGEGDILWHSDSGQVSAWFMNGATISSSATIGSADPAWQIVGAADFNGDGKTDILWENTSGQVVTWLMNGSTITSGTLIGTSADPNWQIKATGDFNGDGDSDILWQNTNGQAVIWFMNGSTVSSGAVIGNPGSSMHVVGTGDFDGDGKSDIVLQDASGQTSIWLMNGSTVASSPLVGNPGAGWRLAGVGDFNGDGKSDILWQQASTGQADIWFMNGTTVTSDQNIGAAPGPAWTIANVADLNGDGRSDIIWQNTNGQAVAWLVNGTTILSQPAIGSNQGPSWHIINTTT